MKLLKMGNELLKQVYETSIEMYENTPEDFNGKQYLYYYRGVHYGTDTSRNGVQIITEFDPLQCGEYDRNDLETIKEAAAADKAIAEEMIFINCDEYDDYKGFVEI